MGMDRLTLLDVARQTDPSGKAARIAKVLTQVNPILQDIPWMPSNAPLGNRVTVEVALPSVEWGKLNKGVTRSKGVTRQHVDTIGLLTGRSEVDVRMADVVSDLQAHRAKEADRFLRAMSNTMAGVLFNGNEESEESSFTGLMLRLATLATSIQGSYVAAHHSAPAGSDYTSIYFVDWGEAGAYGIYPPETTGGLKEKDKGEHQISDADGASYFGYITEYEWWAGLSVEDPRHINRICNIDISQAQADTTKLLVESIIPAIANMPPLEGTRRVAYTRREIITALHIQVLNKAMPGLSVQEYLGAFTPHVLGVPLVACDGISATESLVS